MGKVKLPVSIHLRFLAAIVLLPLASCSSKPTVVPDPAKDFFKKIQDALELAGAKDVTVIAVTDAVNAGPDLKRQVLEEIQSRLHALDGIGILEYPQSRLDTEFKNLNVIPSDGIAPEDAKALAGKLQTTSLLYASIESSVPDVHFKVYSGSTGQIICADMLSGWRFRLQSPRKMRGRYPRLRQRL